MLFCLLSIDIDLWVLDCQSICYIYGNMHYLHELHASCARFSRCVSLGKSEDGSLIQDNLDRGASKEPKNPFPEWIHRFL